MMQFISWAVVIGVCIAFPIVGAVVAVLFAFAILIES